MESDKQETLKTPKEATEQQKMLEANRELNFKLNRAMDRVRMLEAGITAATTATQRIIKEDQDSIEIGAQATGRIKVYGTLGRKTEFALKIKDAFELLEAAQETSKRLTKKLNGGQ